MTGEEEGPPQEVTFEPSPGVNYEEYLGKKMPIRGSNKWRGLSRTMLEGNAECV